MSVARWPGVEQESCATARGDTYCKMNWIHQSFFTASLSSPSPIHLNPPPTPQSHSRGVMSSIWLTEYLSCHSENTLCKTSQCWGVICSRTPVSLCPPLGVSCAKCGLWSHKPVPRSARLQDAPDPGPPRHWYNFIHGGMQLLYWPGAGKGTCKDTTSL